MLTITRGRTFAFDATIYDTYVADGDPANVPTNHTGWTIRSQIRTKVGNKLVANLNVTFPVPTAGTIAIRHQREFTRSLPVGDYWWDIVATDPSGADHVYVEPEPISVKDHPTDPADATYSFVPGGGGVISHTHSISDVTGLQEVLDGLELPPGGTIAHYLRGDRTWQTLGKSSVGLNNVQNINITTWAGSTSLTTLGLVTNFNVTGVRTAVRIVTADTTLTDQDHTVLVDASAGPVEITLPAVSAHLKREYRIKKVDGTANVVTITAAGGDTIEGEPFLDTDIPGESLTIQGFGTNWNIH
jgi:hypothetical protein